MAKSWDKLDDLGENAFDKLKKDPDFLKKFDGVVKNEGLNRHVFQGEVKPVIDPDTGLPSFLIIGVLRKYRLKLLMVLKTKFQTLIFLLRLEIPLLKL